MSDIDLVGVFPDGAKPEDLMLPWPDVDLATVETSDLIGPGRKDVCTWFMKRTVRCLFEAVMLKYKIYPRDIYSCAEIASGAFPAH